MDDVGKVRAKDGFVIIPADSLLPERLYSAEVGGYWRTRDHKFTLQGSGFSTLLLDAIHTVDTAFIASDGSEIGTLVAEGDTNNIGIMPTSAGASSAACNGSPLPRRGRMEVEGNPEPDQDGTLRASPFPTFPRPSACGGEPEREWLTFEAHLRWSGWKRAEDYGPGATDNFAEATPEGTPAWWTMGFDVDLRLTERTTFSCGIHNLLDRHYKVFASGISAPGRDLRVDCVGGRPLEPAIFGPWQRCSRRQSARRRWPQGSRSMPMPDPSPTPSR